MDSSGALATIAQLAMAVTGFAGLISAFRSRQRRWDELDLYALRFLLLSSISACLLAMLPMVLLARELDESPAWIVCQAALGAWLLLLFVWAQKQQRRKGLRPRRRFVDAAMWVICVTIGLLNLAAPLPAIGPAVRLIAYLAGLFWLLLAAILQFVIQIMSSLRGGEGL